MMMVVVWVAIMEWREWSRGGGDGVGWHGSGVVVVTVGWWRVEERVGESEYGERVFSKLQRLLAPEWKKAAKNLEGKVKLGHVNSNDEKNRYSICSLDLGCVWFGVLNHYPCDEIFSVATLLHKMKRPGKDFRFGVMSMSI
ncbi:hypothetical protein Tco_0944057, partial [Tanacetum coccineum]